jgi:hypothetical protein
MTASELSTKVLNLATQKKDGTWYQSGTGIVLCHGGGIYLITAKHCLMDGSTASNKLVPTLENTHSLVMLFNNIPLNLHEEPLQSNDKICFVYPNLSKDLTIDLAILKLNSPSPAIKNYSIDSSEIDPLGDIEYGDRLYAAGYQTDHENTIYELFTTYLPNQQQQLLEQDLTNYFMIEKTSDDLHGLSGTAILSLDREKIVGILCGQNRNMFVAYSIYSKYIWECLSQYDLVK